MAIAIVDRGRRRVMSHTPDQAQYGSIPVAQGKAKARAAVKFRRPTKLFEDAVAAGGLGMRLLDMDKLLPLDGGLPVIPSDEIIGAIGVSGMQSIQDAQIAQARADGLLEHDA